MKEPKAKPIFIIDEVEPGTSLEDLCKKLIDYKANAKFMAQCISGWYNTTESHEVKVVAQCTAKENRAFVEKVRNA